MVHITWADPNETHIPLWKKTHLYHIVWGINLNAFHFHANYSFQSKDAMIKKIQPVMSRTAGWTVNLIFKANFDEALNMLHLQILQ